MKIQNKTVTLLLLAALTAASVSCGEGTAAPGDTDSGSAEPGSMESVTEAVTENTVFTDDLPDNLDFGGRQFRIYQESQEAVTWLHMNFDVPEETGDTIDDGIYRRNLAVEQRLNMDFHVDFFKSASEARNILVAGEDDFENIIVDDRTALNYAQEELIHSYYDLKYVDLSKPYWSQTLNAALSIGGKLYFAYGDYNLTTYDFTHMMLFNKTMLNDFDLPDLYETVKAGKWTYDVFEEYSKAVRQDLDNDGKLGEGDVAGFSSQEKHVLPDFWISAGEESVKKNADDIPEFNLVGDEKFASVIMKIFDLTYGNDIYSKDENLFKNNASLFTDSSAKGLETSRNWEVDFGIVPFPKWDEAQKTYASRVEGGKISVIPVASEAMDFIGAVMEAWSCESRNTTIPAYYDVALKGKGARDEESEAMLDLIFANRIYDLGDTYWCNTLRDGIFYDMFKANDTSLTSKLEGVSKSLQDQIAKSVEAFEKLN